MRDSECVEFLQWALPRLRLRWPGFRKVRGQVCKRLRRRLTALGLETLDQYRHRLESDAGEWPVLDGLCHITVSRFYRDRRVFNVLGRRILPELAEAAGARDGAVRCWCAGCASGEEVYTLRILWDRVIQAQAPSARLDIVGTDADEAVLRRAERGCFAKGSLKEVPADWLALAFERRDGHYCVRDRHRHGVAFALQDIRQERPAGPFDLILCRNLVFTYFEPELQRLMLTRMAEKLNEPGYLVVGSGEALPDCQAMFEQSPECREIYRKVAAGASRPEQRLEMRPVRAD
jgi:chemotaxis protein methyltransferase CheR